MALIAVLIEASLATPVSVAIGGSSRRRWWPPPGLSLDRLVWALRAGRVFLPDPRLHLPWIVSARGTAYFDAVGAQVIAVLVLVLVLRSTCFFRLAGTRDRPEVMSTCLATLLLGIGEL